MRFAIFVREWRRRFLNWKIDRLEAKANDAIDAIRRNTIRLVKLDLTAGPAGPAKR